MLILMYTYIYIYIAYTESYGVLGPLVHHTDLAARVTDSWIHSCWISGFMCPKKTRYLRALASRS